MIKRKHTLINYITSYSNAVTIMSPNIKKEENIEKNIKTMTYKKVKLRKINDNKLKFDAIKI